MVGETDRPAKKQSNEQKYVFLGKERTRNIWRNGWIVKLETESKIGSSLEKSQQEHHK